MMRTSIQSQIWRLLAILSIAAFVLSGCAGTPATPEQIIKTVEVPVVQTVEVQTTVEVEKVVEVTPTPGPATGPILNPEVSGNIELWHFWASPVRRTALRRLIAMCQQKLPNIKVTDTVKPFGDIWTANIAAVAAGSGMPDVIISDRPKLRQDAADGVYMNLQEWADRDNVKPDQFYQWAWDQSVYENATYGIPFETDVRVLFYNKNLFEAAGLDPNNPPKTWDELWAAADKLDVKNPDGTYARMAFFPLFGNASAEVWGYTNGAQWVTPEGQPVINDPKSVATYEWIKKWVDRYGGWQAIQDFRSKYGAPPNDLFQGGGVAMIADIAGYNSSLQFYRPKVNLDNDGDANNDPRMDWGVSLLPYGEAPASWSGGFAMSIPTGAKNAEAAWEFIKCATGAAGQASWARDTFAQPTNIEAANDPVLVSDPLWATVAEALKSSTGGQYLTKYPNWGEQLAQREEAIWNGDTPVQQALDEAQQAVEDAIK